MTSNRFVANIVVANESVGKEGPMALKKSGSNWVSDDRFFDREAELDMLRERLLEGQHILLTAQRRMGKTSLVREVFRRLDEEGEVRTVFVDLEGAETAPDAIAAIAAASRSVRGAWRRLGSGIGSLVEGGLDRLETVSVHELQVKLRARTDEGNWRSEGDLVLDALAASDRPLVLAMDELPILINRLLARNDRGAGREAADLFLSWLRRNGQRHRHRLTFIVLGSVSLPPILRRAGLSAKANIYNPFPLDPWDEETASRCLAALAATYGLRLPERVRAEMCRRLRCCVPHHVQLFFEKLHRWLQRKRSDAATLDDVKVVYERLMLGPQGQPDLDHYETRLREILRADGYRTALELLTEAAVTKRLSSAAIRRYQLDRAASGESEDFSIEDVLHVLEHDGYLERCEGGYRFVSGLLEDWWRSRHGRTFVPILDRGA